MFCGVITFWDPVDMCHENPPKISSQFSPKLQDKVCVELREAGVTLA